MKKSRKGHESKRWLERLKRVECSTVTYVNEQFPIVMKKAQGMYVRDIENLRYIDFSACFGVHALGHRPKELLTAFRKQSAKLIHGMGDVHPSDAKVLFLEYLSGLLPFQETKIHLSLSGGEAVETAIKTALLYTKKKRFLTFSGGYHGLHFGPLSLIDRPLFTQGFESWVEGKSCVLPMPYSNEDFQSFPQTASVHELLTEKYLKETHGYEKDEIVLEMVQRELKKGDIAAIVIEPIQGRGGKRSFSHYFLQECRKLADCYSSLIIYDEVFSGFGRTGTMFAFESTGTQPDLLCLGKAMGGGLPLSACVGPNEIMSAWGEAQGEARHTSTFLGHPLACATGLAALKKIKSSLPEFCNELNKINSLFSNFINLIDSDKDWERKYPIMIRGKGFMRGIWFVNQKEGFAVPLMEKLLTQGVIVLPEGLRADVISLTPPLIAQQSHFKMVLDKISKNLT